MCRSQILISDGSSYFSYSYYYTTCRHSQRRQRHPGSTHVIARYKWTSHSKVTPCSGFLTRYCGRTRSSGRRHLPAECLQTQSLVCLSGNVTGCAGRTTSVLHSTARPILALLWKREQGRKGRQCVLSRKNGYTRLAQHPSRRFGRWGTETWGISRTRPSAYFRCIAC
jgi:hypothetical protein